jgi:diguanylate cyclase (GGDEF)-like protein
MPSHTDVRFRRERFDRDRRVADHDRFPRVQGVGRDVTELRTLQRDLKELALHDPLTGLANRRLLNELLEVGLARSLRSGLPLAVAFLDLDDLKTVNDAHGHDAGDVVLCETARRLMSLVRGADVVARIGGDEFVIVYEPTDTSSDDLIPRIKSALSSPIRIAQNVTVPARRASATWTLEVGHLAAAPRLCRRAAMYESKQARRLARRD